MHLVIQSKDYVWLIRLCVCVYKFQSSTTVVRIFWLVWGLRHFIIVATVRVSGWRMHYVTERPHENRITNVFV